MRQNRGPRRETVRVWIITVSSAIINLSSSIAYLSCLDLYEEDEIEEIMIKEKKNPYYDTILAIQDKHHKISALQSLVVKKEETKKA